MNYAVRDAMHDPESPLFKQMELAIQRILRSDDPNDVLAGIKRQFKSGDINRTSVICINNWASDEQVVQAFEFLSAHGFVWEAVYLMERKEVIFVHYGDEIVGKIQTMVLTAVREKQTAGFQAIASYIPEEHRSGIYSGMFQLWYHVAEQENDEDKKINLLSDICWTATTKNTPEAEALAFSCLIEDLYPEAAKQIRDYHQHGIEPQGLGLFGTLLRKVLVANNG